jgi:hypothetical protein
MKDRGEKKFVVIPFFWSHNFTKLNYFIFEMLKKKIWANFRGIIELFTRVADPNWIRIQSGQWIRNPDPDPRGQK